MVGGKRKFIEDAAKVIDGRVAALKAELARDMERELLPSTINSDRAAILEAEHCARLIRALARAPYRGDPYEVAKTALHRADGRG
jgi:hypothetical protein